MNKLETLKNMIFKTDNKACFIERERILARLEKEFDGYSGEDKYAKVLSILLSEVSVPIDDNDYFAGRVVEALPDKGMDAPSWFLNSKGHMSFDYEKLLRVGFKGILEEICQNAEKINTDSAKSFANNAKIVVEAVRSYAERYSAAAEQKGFLRMAKALKKVPFEPAYDFYSALQSVWLVHMIASCYVGSRDYAFGRFDSYMLPFYKKALQEGETTEELTEILAGFMIKANEICGRTAHNHQSKPVLSQSSKQYINIGGEAPNEFSSVVLNAAMLNCMPQPHITVLLKPNADSRFTENVFSALSVLKDKLHIYNYDLVKNALMGIGVPEEIAKDFTYSACSTLDLNYHSFRLEHFTPTPQIFLKTLKSKEFKSLEELLEAYTEAITENLQEYADQTQKGFEADRGRRCFVLDSLLLTDSATECRYACDGEAKYNVLNLFCPAVATIGDSLLVLDKLVFSEKRYSYSEFIKILDSDYAEHEELRQGILKYTFFGNDTDADKYTVMAGNAFLNAVAKLKLKSNFFGVPGFYSLERDNSWANEIGATPNGRKAGEPVSENQSPTYGADKKGMTALLKSLAKLPFGKTATGGLNLTFAADQSPEALKNLVLTYFQLGGFHVGISVINREQLLDAMENPEKYQSLTVRLYGFSEYFVSLPKWQQLAVLNRTEL